jgi:protein disulfide-isomerase
MNCMKLLKGLILVGALAVTTAAMAQTTDYYAAVKESKKTKKPIMLQFTGSDWCGWCVKLDKEVFATREFKTWAKANVVWLVVDLPRNKKQSKSQKDQNMALVQKYNVQGFPTVLFTDAKGEVKGEMGYLEGGPKAWTAEARKQLKG